jgi:hypothetical protein
MYMHKKKKNGLSLSSIQTTKHTLLVQFWTLPESMDDVYTLVSPADIRRARDHARENLETLIDKVSIPC